MKVNNMHNISAPWEKNAFGFYPLGKKELEKRVPSCCEKWYKLSYDWVKALPLAERDSHYTLSYDWIKSLPDNFATGEDNSKLIDLIEEDKEILLRRDSKLRFLYGTEDAFAKGRRHGLKNRDWKDSGGNSFSRGRARDTQGSAYIIRKALNAIRVNELDRDSLASYMMYTDVDFEEAARIWKEFRHSPGLKVLKNFKVRGRCFSFTVSYKGREKEVKIYIRKRSYSENL